MTKATYQVEVLNADGVALVKEVSKFDDVDWISYYLQGLGSSNALIFIQDKNGDIQGFIDSLQAAYDKIK